MANREAADRTVLGADLGIDTASNEVSLALLRADDVLLERRWRIETNVSLELLAALDQLLREADVERAGIASIAVATGPGGYSGLRAGLATAQGLALALDVPLAGVSRLEADALPLLEEHPGDEQPVVAVHDAGRSGYAWAAYVLDDPGAPPRTLVVPRVDDAATCAREAPAGARWCGEIAEPLAQALGSAQAVGQDADRTSSDTGASDASAEPPVRATSVVRLARLHAAYGDPEAVDVIYLRPPPITRPRA